MEPQFDKEVQFFLDIMPMDEVIESYRLDHDARWLSYMRSRMVRQPHMHDRFVAARDVNTPAPILWMLRQEGDPEDLEGIAGNEGAPADLLRDVSFTGYKQVWQELINNPNTPEDVFEDSEAGPPRTSSSVMTF